jgi:hypothetical protein
MHGIRGGIQPVRVAALLLLLLACPLYQSHVCAQDVDAPRDRLVVLAGGHYGSPTGIAGTLGVLIGRAGVLKPGASPDSSRAGLLVAGSAGTGGFRAEAGIAALALEGPHLATGFDALFTVTRTTGSPRGALAQATYLGGEAGLTIMDVRVSVGAAHAVSGSTAGGDTRVTWSVGVRLPFWW